MLSTPRIESWPKTVLCFGLLISTIIFDGGNSFMGFFDSTGIHSAIYAANKDHTSNRLLKEVVPGADSFSEKEGKPPVYKAYRNKEASGEKTLIGYAFVSADVPPEPSGFSGEIDSLVGMDLEGNIIGLRVIYYKESLRHTWGDFLEFPGVQEQCMGKRAADRFSVGRDIDGISKATISAKAMAKGIRQSVRAITEAYIK
tara:strand:- start:831 stop:1430 length:600 start_codon:yes stop_codon:yes gene_type:complete